MSVLMVVAIIVLSDLSQTPTISPLGQGNTQQISIDPFVGQLILAIITSSLAALLTFIFTKRKSNAEIAKLIAETDKIKVESEILIKQSKATEAALNTVVETQKTTQNALENIETAIAQGSPYRNYMVALPTMEQFIQIYLDGCKETGKQPTVKLRLIAVAMTFSWEAFIVNAIPRFLEDSSKPLVDVEIAWVDHSLLEQIKIASKGINWAKKSRERVDDVQEFFGQLGRTYDRLTFSAWTYRNLPHWHGWLVNEEHLFLGRTDWVFENGNVYLTVGQNKYRHFDGTSAEGSERISLFRDWHSFYTRPGYETTLICTNNREIARKHNKETLQ